MTSRRTSEVSDSSSCYEGIDCAKVLLSDTSCCQRVCLNRYHSCMLSYHGTSSGPSELTVITSSTQFMGKRHSQSFQWKYKCVSNRNNIWDSGKQYEFKKQAFKEPPLPPSSRASLRRFVCCEHRKSFLKPPQLPSIWHLPTIIYALSSIWFYVCLRDEGRGISLLSELLSDGFILARKEGYVCVSISARFLTWFICVHTRVWK